MATRRLDKVNELMKREIGSFIQKEFEWNGTIVSILQVEITEDLKEGRVWVGDKNLPKAPPLPEGEYDPEI